MTDGALVIRAHGDRIAGAGHVMRCMALAEAWIARGGRATMALSQGAGALEQRLAAGGTEVVRIAGAPGTAADAMATRQLAEAREATALVLDGYCFDGEYIEFLYVIIRNRNATDRRTVAMDIDGISGPD